MEKVDFKKAFVEMIQQNERIIYKICSVYTTTELPIPDLYQEVVCNLWAGFAKFRHECSVSTWIYRVAINTCITETRKDIRHPKSSVLVANLAELLPAPESMTDDIREMYRLINQLKTIEKYLLWTKSLNCDIIPYMLVKKENVNFKLGLQLRLKKVVFCVG